MIDNIVIFCMFKHAAYIKYIQKVYEGLIVSGSHVIKQKQIITFILLHVCRFLLMLSEEALLLFLSLQVG